MHRNLQFDIILLVLNMFKNDLIKHRILQKCLILKTHTPIRSSPILSLRVLYSTINKMSNKETSSSSLDRSIMRATPASYINLSVVSNGFMNSPKSCVIRLDSSRILINCGEGTERSVARGKLGISRIDSILLTRFDWSTIGGIQGLCQNLISENGFKSEKQISLHAPIDFKLNNKYLSIKKFLFPKEMKVDQHDYFKKSEFRGEQFNLQQFTFNSSKTNEPVCSYLFNFIRAEPNINKEKLDAKLVEFNFKPGPWISRFIKKGLDFESDGPNGKVLIKASDLLDYSNSTEHNILFLDLPDLKCLDKLKHTVLNPDSVKKMTLIVHMSNSDILNNREYIEYIKELKNAETIHLFLDEKYPNIDLPQCFELQAKLNLINEDIFKLMPVQSREFASLFNSANSSLRQLQKEIKIVQGQTGMEFKMRPMLTLNLAEVNGPIDNNESRNKIFEYYENVLSGRLDYEKSESEERILSELKEKIQVLENREQSLALNSSNKEKKYPNILFLGTNSANPTSTRNVSSIIIQINQEKNFLFDCGEFTIGQLTKYYDQQRRDHELIKLKAIFISHNHLDHHFGLTGVLKTRIEAFERSGVEYEKLVLFYPTNLKNILNFSSDLIFDKRLFRDYVELVPNNCIQHYENWPSSSQNMPNYQMLLKKLGLFSIKTTSVDHIPFSYGICLDIDVKNDCQNSEKSGFRLVYSGDCRPSENLVALGKDCDLLIHECTFDNTCQQEAIKKRHSTLDEALEISKKMNAKYTIFTHFSSRYSKFSIADEINKQNCAFAFDFMSVDPSTFHLMNQNLLEYLNVIFKKYLHDYEEVKNKKIKISS
jgi:ribonuclease Z